MDLPIERMETMTDAEASAFWDELTQQWMLGDDEAARSHLAAGLPIYYAESDMAEELAIKEYPDGHRELVRLDIENGNRIVEHVVRQFDSL